MKCCKKVFVVVVDKTQPNWQFCNFFSGLKAAGCWSKNYIFFPVLVDPTTKCWDKCVLKKINIATEKYGSKPYLVSGLYDADLEIKLTQFALLVCKILLATTVEGIASLINMELLPSDSNCSKFTSTNYLNDNKYSNAVIACPPPIISCTKSYTTSTSNALAANNNTKVVYSKELPENLNENYIIVSSFAEKQWIDGLFLKHPSVSDDTLYDIVKYSDFLKKLVFDLSSNTIIKGPAAFVKLPVSGSAVDGLFSAAGIWVNEDNILEANQLKVLGSRVGYWLKCNC